MIDRVFLLQLLIDNLNVDRYLEIGVFKGDCFLQLNVPRKICVDPHIKFLSGTRFNHFKGEPIVK